MSHRHIFIDAFVPEHCKVAPYLVNCRWAGESHSDLQGSACRLRDPQHLQLSLTVVCGLASPGNMSSHKGLNGACSVHKYTGTFAGQPVHFKMTSVCGHVMTLDFLGKMTSPLLPLTY